MSLLEDQSRYGPARPSTRALEWRLVPPAHSPPRSVGPGHMPGGKGFPGITDKAIRGEQLHPSQGEK